MRNWHRDGWTDQEWDEIAKTTGFLNHIAVNLDKLYGGGGGGCEPQMLDQHIANLETVVQRLRTVLNHY